MSLQVLNRSNLILVLKIAIIIAATLAIFYQDLTIVANDALHIEFMSHILVIPFLFSYLIYRKRKMLRAVIPFETRNQQKETRFVPTIAGTILSATAILLYWHGSYTFTPLEYHMFALPIFAAGLILVLFNIRTLRQLAFPIAFLIFLTPPPSEVLYALGSTLSVTSSEASYTIIKSLGIPSTLTSEYGNPIIQITGPDGATTSFAVDIACSGIYSLIGFLIFSVFIAYIIRDKPWKKLALLLIGFSTIYILNITRITTVLLIGYHYGEETAIQLFHLLGGWILIFIGTLLLLILAERIFHTQIFSNPAQTCSECNLPKSDTNQRLCLTCGRIRKPAPIKFQKPDIIKMTAIALSVALLMSIQAPVFALTQAPAIVLINTPMGQQVSTEVLPRIAGYNLKFAYRDTTFETRVRGFGIAMDMALLYIYSPTNRSQTPIWAAVEIASTRLTHGWETCLITWRVTHGLTPATQIELKDIQIAQNPPMISRFFVFEWRNDTQAVLYWYESATFQVNSTSQQKYVKISLLAFPKSLEDLPSLENQLVTLATAIISYWQPIKTWSQIALLLSQRGAQLAAITSTLLVPIAVLYARDRRKQRKANAKAYRKLSEPNKQIIDTVLETEKTTTPTLGAIADRYKNRTGESIEGERLQQKLSEAEKTGLIKRDIDNNHDEPTQIWKTQVSLGDEH